MIQMRLSGATEAEIARSLGVTPGFVHKELKRRLAEVRRDDKEAVDQEWALQNARYERLLNKWWPLALGQDDIRTREATESGASNEHDETRQFKATQIVLDILRRIDTIGGLIPEKPLVNINVDNRSQYVIGDAGALDTLRKLITERQERLLGLEEEEETGT